ncbi:MAG: hypothetical protein ACRCSY_08780, partial [Cetobacterium sp.]
KRNLYSYMTQIYTNDYHKKFEASESNRLWSYLEEKELLKKSLISYTENNGLSNKVGIKEELLSVHKVIKTMCYDEWFEYILREAKKASETMKINQKNKKKIILVEF